MDDAVSKFGRRERWRYKFDNVMSRGTLSLIGLLALVSAALVVIVGVVSVLFAEEEEKTGEEYGPGRAIWRSLLRALDPGTMGGDSGRPVFLGLMLVVTLGGIFIVATLIGVLNTGLDTRLALLRKGRSRVVEEGHVVILGWSEQIFTIVPELVAANESEKSSCITILADKDKVEMEEELRSRVGPTGNTRVVCRTGAPHEPADLDIVSPEWAKAILVLSPEEGETDALVIKTLLALDNREWHGPQPHVVAAVTETQNLGVARMAGGERAVVVDADEITAGLVVQTSRQAGLSVVFTDLLDFDGDEIYMRHEPRLVGVTYGDALYAYETATLMGLVFADGRIVLNPPMGTRIGPADRVILLAEDDSLIRLASQASAVAYDAIARGRTSDRDPERILLLGWNKRAATIVAELDSFVPAGSQLQIVANRPAESVQPDALQVRLVNIRLAFKEADSNDRSALESLNVGAFDHVIVLADDSVNAEGADAHTLVTLLQLRDMERQQGERYSIVSEMNDERNRELAQVAKADDFVVGGKLISLLMSQLAENRHLAGVFASLFESDGSELHVRPAEDYVHSGAWLNFATVIEAARARGETAIGYRVRSRSLEPMSYGIKLNPSKQNPLVLEPGDGIVLLAEE